MAKLRKPPVPPRACAIEPGGEITSPTLLDRVRDWRDHPAWLAFFERYNPLLRRWCLRFGLDSEASDELCQRVWVELMARMRTFRYDPSRTFRGWLWRFFRCRAIDLLRKRRSEFWLSTCELPLEVPVSPSADDDPSEDAGGFAAKPASPVLQRVAAEAQEAVRSRVDPGTWQAYWAVAIEDRPFRETADSLGKSYTAVYNGYKRVDRMLRDEGERRLAALMAPGSQSSDSRQR